MNVFKIITLFFFHSILFVCASGEWIELFDGKSTKGWQPRSEVVSFEAKDGDIIIACGNDQQFKSLCNAFEWDFANSKKFSTNKKRIKNRIELISEFIDLLEYSIFGFSNNLFLF